MGDRTDVAAIERLKARYFRTLDTKDWDGLVRVFTDEVTVDVAGSGGPTTTSAAAFVERVQRSLGDAITVHHGHMPEIDITSETTATGIWAMEDKIWWPDGSAVRFMHGYGHYHETYVRLASGWRIATMQLTRLHREFEP
jgi:hypothetical protein